MLRFECMQAMEFSLVAGGVGAKLNVVCSAIDPPNTYCRAAAARLPRGYGLRSNTA